MSASRRILTHPSCGPRVGAIRCTKEICRSLGGEQLPLSPCGQRRPVCVHTAIPTLPTLPMLSFQFSVWETNCGTLSSSYIAMRCSEIRSCMTVKTIQRWQLSCRFELVSSLDLSKSDFDTSWPLTNTSPQLSKASSRRADNMASTIKSLTVNDRRRNGRKLDASWWCGILTQMLLVDAVTWSRPLSESKNASGVRKGKSWNKIVVVAQSLETKTRLGSAANGILNIKHMMIKYAKYILIYIYILLLNIPE